ncbi:hypothetical protein NKH18_10465 [Streptomyces sp. M10(2022)]
MTAPHSTTAASSATRTPSTPTPSPDGLRPPVLQRLLPGGRRRLRLRPRHRRLGPLPLPHPDPRRPAPAPYGFVFAPARPWPTGTATSSCAPASPARPPTRTTSWPALGALFGHHRPADAHCPRHPPRRGNRRRHALRHHVIGLPWQDQRFAEYLNTGPGARIAVPGNRPQLSADEARSHTPADYLGDWRPYGSTAGHR